MLGRRSDARALGRSDARVFGRLDVRTSERPDVWTPGRSDAYSPHFQFLRPPRRGPELGRAVTSQAAPALAAAAAKIAKNERSNRNVSFYVSLGALVLAQRINRWLANFRRDRGACTGKLQQPNAGRM